MCCLTIAAHNRSSNEGYFVLRYHLRPDRHLLLPQGARSEHIEGAEQFGVRCVRNCAQHLLLPGRPVPDRELLLRTPELSAAPTCCADHPAPHCSNPQCGASFYLTKLFLSKSI